MSYYSVRIEHPKENETLITVREEPSLVPIEIIGLESSPAVIAFVEADNPAHAGLVAWQKGEAHVKELKNLSKPALTAGDLLEALASLQVAGPPSSGVGGGSEDQMNQAHSDFKVFVSEPTDAGHIPEDVCKSLRDFVATQGVAAKSVGVEYLEAYNKIVISLGYRSDEPTYPVTLKTSNMGNLGLDPADIEAAMSAHAARSGDVICHEFYVTKQGEYFFVLLVRD